MAAEHHHHHHHHHHHGPAGFGRAFAIGTALLNAILLLLAVGAIAWEAIQRLRAPEPMSEATVIWVAAIGIAVNTATALLFLRGREHDLNIRAAFLHMTADAAVSAGVVLAALPGVREVHDLHIWGLSTADTALTAHLVHNGTSSSDLLRRATHLVQHDFGIRHATIQIETPEEAEDCRLRPHDVT